VSFRESTPNASLHTMYTDSSKIARFMTKNRLPRKIFVALRFAHERSTGIAPDLAPKLATHRTSTCCVHRSPDRRRYFARPPNHQVGRRSTSDGRRLLTR